MSKNEVYRIGQYVPVPVPENTPAGTAIRVGGLNHVTVTPRSSFEGEFGNHIGEASADLGGAYKLPVTVSGGALTYGKPIYITAAGALVTTATDNTLFGHALEYNVPNGAKQVVVKISN